MKDTEIQKKFQDPVYRQLRSKQPLPYNFEIELVEGCNLFCDHCGIRTQWGGKKEFHYMTTETAEKLSKAIGKFTPKVRICFAMHGEPTLNPDFPEIIQSFRTNVPLAQLSLFTNGIVMRKKGNSYVKELFKAGLNIICLSSYNAEQNAFAVAGVDMIDFLTCDKVKYNVHYYHNPKKTRWILDVGDLKENSGNRKVRTMFNMGGNVDFSLTKKYGIFPLKKSLQRLCTKPFHDFVIDYDGTVPTCCLDWKRKQVLGKFPEESLESIWFGKKFTALRTIIRNKRRDLLPLCSQCDYVGGLMLALIPHCFGDLEEACVTLGLSYKEKQLPLFEK